jgi:hypothetical protein
MLFSPEIIEEAKTKILPAELHKSPEGGFPKIYTFENKEKKIVFFAAKHAAEEEQFEKITAAFNDLKPSIVFVEGMERYTKDGPLKEDFQQKIADDKKWQEFKKKHIENVFTYKLAFDNHLPIISPEYTDEESISFFKEKGYSEDEIFLFFCSQIAMNYAYQPHADSLESFLNKQVKGIYGTEKAYYENFARLARQTFGGTVDLETGEGFKAKCTPIPFSKEDGQEWYITNEMSRQLSLRRNQKILEEIAKQLEFHDRIFIVYGGSHGVMLEPAIGFLMHH